MNTALAALGDYSQFVIWRLEPQRIARDGKTYKASKLRPAGYSDPLIEKLPIDGTVKAEKVPIDPGTLNYGDAKKPIIWLPAAKAFGRAVELNQDNGDGTQPYGVGFVLTASDPFFCLDIDNCAVEGGWSPLVTELAQQLPGVAIEVSHGKAGLHIWGKYQGLPPDHACKNTALNIELYTEQRFIALGRPDATGSAATDCTDKLPGVVAAYFAPTVATDADWTDGPCEGWDGYTDDTELLTKARRARSANALLGDKATFADLWKCDADALSRAWPVADRGDGLPFDASSADAALAQHLAFFTGKDCERMQRLMRQSKLQREKWDSRPDYLPRTILHAVSICTSVYTRQASAQAVNGADTDTQPGVIPGLGLLETPGESTIAKVIKANHEGEHCYSVKSKRWYSREQNKLWRFDEAATRLKKLILGYMETYGLKRGNQITGVLKFLEVEFADWGQWDDEPNLCGLPDDQVLNLATGQVQPAKVTDRISRRLGAIPIQGTPTRWLQFLTETMPINESAAYISWLQVWFGYVLTGHTRERRFVFMSGSGGNGKSVLLDTLAAIMGDYAVTLQSAALFGEKQDHSEWKTKLDGPRLASVAEVSPGVKWKTVDLKEFTGGTGATIAARAMRQNTYNFSPTAKIIIVGNDRPDLETVDNAIRDRIILLELDRRPARPDKKLIEKLREEHGQILAWMIKGSQNYLRDGLPDIPASAKAATADYLSNEDQFSQFIEDCFAETPGGRVSNSEIAQALATWNMANNIFRGWTKARVTKEMKKRGYQGYNSAGVRGFLGLTRKSIRTLH